MFRSSVTIIRELYVYLTKVTFMLKKLGNIMSLYRLGDVAACLPHRHITYNDVILLLVD